jgi:hypothetical protein
MGRARELGADTGEGFVVQMSRNALWVDRQTPGFFTGLSRSLAGDNYVTYCGRRIFTRRISCLVLMR